jgi:YD repeat-containing protein
VQPSRGRSVRLRCCSRGGYPESDPRIGSVTTILNDANEQSQVTYTYDSAYPNANNVSQKDESDSGSGSPGSLLRRTNTSYHYINQVSQSCADPCALILDLPDTVTVSDGSGHVASKRTYTYDGGALQGYGTVAGHDDVKFGSGFNSRGNPTIISDWADPTNQATSIQRTFAYDVAGSAISSTDANRNATTFSYADNYSDGQGRNTYAHVTKVTNALGQSETWQWDYGTGKPITAADFNGVQTIYTYNDPLDRVTLVRKAAGTSAETQTAATYPSPVEIDVYNDQITKADQALRTQTLDDGLGREVEMRQYESSSGYISTTKSYDALGRLYQITNPSRPNDGLNFATTYSYDALNRVTLVKTADGAATTTSYSGNQTTVTDAAGHQRSTYMDGVGRLTEVVEDPGSSPHLHYVTTYAYDVLDDLTGVNQSGRTRTFGYDSLKRLTAATNPESGAASYTYDGAGNVLTKIDGRGEQTGYAYDVLNRLTSKNYSGPVATPPATYIYCNSTSPCPGVLYSEGRLLSVSNSNSTTNYTQYDALGRITVSSQTTAGQSYFFGYQFNRAGALTSETYPSGRVVNTGFDGANRPVTATGLLGSGTTNYITQTAYWPHGGIYYYVRGNNVWYAASYNSRLQRTESYEAVANSSRNMLFVSCPNWGVNTNVGVYDLCPHAAATNDNGNLQSYTVDRVSVISGVYSNFWIRRREPAGVGQRIGRLVADVQL